MRVFSHVPVHFAILLGFSICLGGGGAGGGDAVRRGFFAAGFFGGAAGMRSSVAPLLMFVMRKAGAFLAAGLRDGHWGGAPPPLPPYMLALLLNSNLRTTAYSSQRCLNRQMDRFSTAVGESYQPLSILREQLAAIMAKKRAAARRFSSLLAS